MWHWTIALITVAAVLALAEEADYDPRFLAACLYHMEGEAARAGCIGIGAQVCLDSERTDSAQRMAGCYAAEHDDWQARQDSGLAGLREKHKSPDMLTEGLAARQVWAADLCGAYALTVTDGGETLEVAREECLMRETAQAALTLEPYVPVEREK